VLFILANFALLAGSWCCLDDAAHQLEADVFSALAWPFGEISLFHKANGKTVPTGTNFGKHS
jgi:hypothetical protein